MFLAPHLYAADLSAGRVPPVATAAARAGLDVTVPGAASPDTHRDNPAREQVGVAAGGGEGQGEESDDDGGAPEGEAGGAQEGGPGPAGALSLHGLVRRMARLADDRTWPAQSARLAALRFGAALASRLGTGPVEPYLPTLLRPLYRITEGAAASPDEVRGYPTPNTQECTRNMSSPFLSSASCPVALVSTAATARRVGDASVFQWLDCTPYEGCRQDARHLNYKPCGILHAAALACR